MDIPEDLLWSSPQLPLPQMHSPARGTKEELVDADRFAGAGGGTDDSKLFDRWRAAVERSLWPVYIDPVDRFVGPGGKRDATFDLPVCDSFSRAARVRAANHWAFTLKPRFVQPATSITWNLAWRDVPERDHLAEFRLVVSNGAESTARGFTSLRLATANGPDDTERAFTNQCERRGGEVSR